MSSAAAAALLVTRVLTRCIGVDNTLSMLAVMLLPVPAVKISIPSKTNTTAKSTLKLLA